MLLTPDSAPLLTAMLLAGFWTGEVGGEGKTVKAWKPIKCRGKINSSVCAAVDE